MEEPFFFCFILFYSFFASFFFVCLFKTLVFVSVLPAGPDVGRQHHDGQAAEGERSGRAHRPAGRPGPRIPQLRTRITRRETRLQSMHAGRHTGSFILAIYKFLSLCDLVARNFTIGRITYFVGKDSLEARKIATLNGA